MKYTADEAFEEIRRRGKKLKLDHEKRMAKLMWAVSSILSIAIIGITGIYSSGASYLNGQTDYGSFLLYAGSGGYVLTAVAAFIAGVFLTLILQKHGGRKG